MTVTTVVLAAALQGQVAPPPPPFDCSAAEYRQLDFWVGDWDVVPNPRTVGKASGPQPTRPPARNVIEKIQGGCVVLETWDDGQGGTGQSFNIFDRVSQQWHQIWVSNNGGLHFYRGGIQNGRMVYLGEVPLPPAARFQGRRTVRLSFEAPGPDTVRQLSESLNADGTWSVNYDFIYTRRPSSGRNDVPDRER